MKARERTVVVIALLLAAILGGLVGVIVGHYIPEGAAKTLFSHAFEVGFDNVSVNFYSISFSIGLQFKFNFVSILTVVLTLIYFRWWYY